MKLALLRKRYNLAIISFILLSSLIGKPLSAYTGNHGHGPVESHGKTPQDDGGPRKVGNRLYFTPACPIIAENFNQAADVNGAKLDPGATGWYLDTTKVPNAAYFAIKSHRIKAQTLKGEGVWYSKVFSIAGYTGIQFDVKVSNEGTKSNSEYVKVYYKLNGGPEVLDTAMFGNMGTPLVTSQPMTGNTIQLVVRMYDTTAGNSEYYIEQYDVFKETGPCTVSGITVTASASNSGVLTCANPSTTLTANTTATGTTTYAWTGPNSFTATGASVAVSTVGTYTVTGTNSAGTGTTTVTVTSNTTSPGTASASNNGPLTCTTTSVTLTGTSATTSGVTYAWTGPNSFTASGASATATAAGTYTVTATNTSTGCTATAMTTVIQTLTAPGTISAGNNGPLTCNTPSVTLSGSSSLNTGVTYAWTGPNSYTATGASATAVNTGTYTLTATNTSSGCTATATTTVTSNFTVPTNVTATNTGPLTCSTTSVTLNASSSTTSGVTYSWGGPGGFVANGASVTTTVPGTYSMMAVYTATGCTVVAATTVAQNTTAPATPTTNPNPSNATLTCTTNFVTLSGSSSTSGVTYAWTGPNNFNVASSSANAFSAGTYTLTATVASTGCKSSGNVTVIQNTTPPQLSPIAPSAATLTCSSPSVTLTGSSSTTGVSYSWSGPNSFTAAGNTAVASAQGSYILTVTDPSNGCTNTTTASISQNFTPPAQVTAINNGPLTCNLTSVTLTGNSQTSGVTYAWTGPNNFTASTATATTSVAGTYTLTVTNPVNGCTTITNTVVAQNTSTPAGLAIGSSTGATLLTCTSPSITLTASTTNTSGITFNWAGPGSLTSSAASISATSPGTYQVTATNSSNGCTASASASVTQNITPPASPLMTSNPVNALISCTTSSVALNANSSNPKVGYSWTGPGGFTFNGMTTSVTLPGTYTVTATDSTNGCTSTSTAVVTEDTTHPTLVATSSVPANSLLTCTNTSVVITASSGTSGVSYSWIGPNGYTANGISATATTSGNYTVTVTNPNNGCSTSVTAATVAQNTDVPNAVSATVTNKLTCSASSATLKGSSSTTGTTYAWTGPNNFTASTQNTVVSVGGTYTLTATNPANGCTFSAPITVQVDKTAPQGVTATKDGDLSCTVGSVNLSGNSTTAGVTYSWAGPNGFIDPEKVVSAVDSGTYFLTVNNPANGCSAVASVTVTADFTECSMIAPKPATGHAASLNNTSAGNTAAGPGLIYKVYPNPVNTTAFVNLTSPETTHVLVEVYNSVGVREKILFDGTVEAGTPYQWTLDASRFTSGIHYCIIRTNNKSYTSKLLISSGRP